MSTAVFAENEDPRLRRRRTIRLRLAERDLIISRRREIESAIRNLDAELDHATNAHQATTSPIQDEISKLEQRRCGLVADRQTVPASLDLRRSELLMMLREANDKLESAASDHKERTLALRREIKAIAESEKRYADLTQHSLAHPSVCNPHLADLHWCAMRAIEFANHRVQAAAAKCKIYQSEIANESIPRSMAASVGTISFNGRVATSIDHERVALYSRRLERWKLELATSEKLLADAMRESESAHQKILDE